MDFAPRLDILPPSQRLLWDDLKQVPSEFILYGGTAVALHLGHRQSIDFDFFAPTEFDPVQLYSSIPFLLNSKVIQQEKNTLTCKVDRGKPVLVSFFGLPKLATVRPPELAADLQLKIASLLDLSGMKALAVQQRAEVKDYIDIDAMMGAGISLPLALSAAKEIHGPAFNPQITLKALTYFDDGDLLTLPNEIKDRLAQAAGAVNLGQLPAI
jgi:hypothetical protein